MRDPAADPTPSPEDLDPIWRGLSAPTRRRILDLLRERPRTTGDLCAAFPDSSRFNVIKHLNVLEQAGLVRVEPRGRERWNHLNAVPLHAIYERWLRPHEAVWAERLWHVKAAAEAGPDRGGPGGAMADATGTEIRIVAVDQEIALAASPARVFAALTDGIADWWGPPYVVAEDRRGIRLDLRAGGLLWEDWGDGQGIAWASLLGFRRSSRLDFTGTFRMTGAIDGTASFELVPDGAGTKLRFSQRAIGAIPDGVEHQWSAGWEDLLGVRLKAAAERGG